ncbi:hypothetical protein [Acinetobacter harbinensis]|uniref:hypothetical protein n=1 Tax=Acinetobacter harbinensis TaxID=1353941 RepID=UPI001C4F44C1|nr:hypothetical protein [Acinetobacter harbinensis]
MTIQKKECGCVSSDLLVQLIQSNQLLVSAVAEQSRVTAEQSKVMALIVDQNSQLMASDDDDDDLGSKYLDS